MRRLVLIWLMAAAVLPAGAARRTTVQQLEQALAADCAVHRADSEVARHIGEFELTERLTDATLDRFAAKLPLGPRTALALQLLADQSAFMDPPAGELPATALPDAATQQRMMDAARGYVAQTLSHLPNFFATRATYRFDDSPQVIAAGDWPVRAGLHLVGTTSREITFRDGKEVQDLATDAASTTGQKAPPELGLHTWGEFGPELSIILTDTAKGTVTFSHWEQTPSGLAAVFSYAVPKAASHYSVNYCCILDQSITINRQGGGGRRGGPAQMPNVANTATKSFSETPGYHGSLSVNAATGAILRITLEAELNSGDPIARAASVVEYGPVKIGDQSYICPRHSLAFSTQQVNSNGRAGNLPVLLINETSFTHYHRLGTSMRMLADAGEPNPATQSAGEQPAAVSGSATASPGQQATVPAPASAPSIPAEPAPIPPQPPTPSQPVIPEISLTEAKGVPDEPASATEPQEGGVTLKVSSRLVDVGIVAYDKKGHPVKDLKAEDFEVYDNGRKQEVRYFSQFAGETVAAPAAASAPVRTFTNRPAEVTAASPALPAAETGATILLIDESHIAWGDLSHARQQMLKFLGELAPGERVGLYSMTGLGFRVLTEVTADHAALIARLQKWMPTAQSVSNAQDEEVRNRQQFNEVHNVADLDSVNGNRVDAPDSDSPVDPQLRALGSNPARASLIILGGVARHLAGVSGHKNLVWVSTDNVFADWADQAVSIDKDGKSIDSFALRAQESMNDAHVSVFPFDVSQLETAAITADIQHRNVELTQAAQETATLGGGSVARNMTPGRITAQMNQDLHPIQGPIRQVAEATGGRTIRRASELAAELAGVVEDGHATYQLSFSPQGPADGQYHAISVKLAGKRGLTLRYRTGYLFSKEPSSLKERFQQAVWRPIDVSEISIQAGVVPMKPGATVKIDIMASDLGLRQQAGRWMDKLDIFFVQRDDAGLHAQVEGQTLGLRLKPSTYQSLLPGAVPFERFVQMKRGMASLRVLVVDENSGRMGSVTIAAPAMEGNN
jgi:VWFA-related protein